MTEKIGKNLDVDIRGKIASIPVKEKTPPKEIIETIVKDIEKELKTRMLELNKLIEKGGTEEQIALHAELKKTINDLDELLLDPETEEISSKEIG